MVHDIKEVFRIARDSVSTEIPGASLLGRILARRFESSPVIVVGVGRSGTSALMQALGRGHGLVSTDRECPSIADLGEFIYDNTFGHAAKHLMRCNRVSSEALRRKIRSLAFELAWGGNHGCIRMLKILIESPSKFMCCRRWVTRAFPNEKQAHGISCMFPGTRFVYIHRNGCDVVQSRIKYKAFCDATFRDNCRAWATGARKYAYLRSRDDCVTIEYDRIIHDRERVFSELSTLLGLDLGVGPAHFLAQNLLIPRDVPGNRTVRGVKVSDVLESRGPSYSDWDVSQKREFREICGEAMSSLGYRIPF